MPFQFNFFESPATTEDDSEKAQVSNDDTFIISQLFPLNLEGEPRLIVADPVEISSGDRPLLMWKRSVSDVMFEMAQKDQELSTENDDKNLIHIAHSQSDLVPSVYEGGFKTWECTYDLICYLDHFIQNNNCLQGQTVLEMGCGSALPGIFCMKNSRAISVDFQDYNREVLEAVTLPNIYANYFIDSQSCEPGKSVEVEMDNLKLLSLPNLGRMVFGDWGTFAEAQSEHQYDLILTSETIYSDLSYRSIVKLFREKLIVGTGKVLLACKSIYFGCGGDSLSFVRFVRDHCKSLCGQYRLVGEKVAEFGNKDSLNREIWLFEWHLIK